METKNQITSRQDDINFLDELFYKEQIEYVTEKQYYEDLDFPFSNETISIRIPDSFKESLKWYCAKKEIDLEEALIDLLMLGWLGENVSQIGGGTIEMPFDASSFLGRDKFINVRLDNQKA